MEFLVCNSEFLTQFLSFLGRILEFHIWNFSWSLVQIYCSTQCENFIEVELIEFFISLEIIWCPYQFLSLYTIMKFPPVWNFYNVNNLNKIKLFDVPINFYHFTHNYEFFTIVEFYQVIWICFFTIWIKYYFFLSNLTNYQNSITRIL